MLETDEVDVDYFTPAESTSLANIFGKSNAADETKDNTSLKYTSLPQPSSKPEEPKQSQWIFTCAVHGFEWSNSGYISRGKLGLAILNVVKNNSHSILLYDSNKTTVSYVAITPKLNIHKRNSLTIAYYDNAQKYWSIQTSDDDMNKILQLLKNLQATIVHKSFQETDREQSDNNKVINKEGNIVKNEPQEDEKETDTDFYMHQKTKDSILKRMANVGQSVLPSSSHSIPKGLTSDSSDSNDSDENRVIIRHKPGKNGPRKISESHNTHEIEGNMLIHSRKVIHKSHMDGQSSSSSKVITTPSCNGDMNVFISEQRMSNSELRININRVADKIDLLLDRVNDVSNIDNSNSLSKFQNDIVQKLIKEYEVKIKCYEVALASKGIDCHTINSTNNTLIKETDSYQSSDILKKQIEELEMQNTKKDEIITLMKVETEILNEKLVQAQEEGKKTIDELMIEIETLNEKINSLYSTKNEEIASIKKNFENIIENNDENNDIANKVKKIMNDTFQNISHNFNDKDSYSGDSIKSIIASVIKKNTIVAIQDS